MVLLRKCCRYTLTVRVIYVSRMLILRWEYSVYCDLWSLICTRSSRQWWRSRDVYRQTLSRLWRTVAQCWSVLCAGIGGSGRQSATKLATYMADYDLFQIEISRNYTMSEWREDIKKVHFTSTISVVIFVDMMSHVARLVVIACPLKNNFLVSKLEVLFAVLLLLMLMLLPRRLIRGIIFK